MSSGGGCRVVFDHFERFSEQANAEGERLVGETAEAIHAAVKSRWSDTRLPIRVRGKPRLKFIVAGSRRRFHAVFLEYGTVWRHPIPAMVPATERVRQRFFAEAKRLERVMR